MDTTQSSGHGEPSTPPCEPAAAKLEQDEDIRLPKLTFSTAATTSIQQLEEGLAGKDDEKKRARKSVDENTIRKRKDTSGSSISNIIHRFTWGKFGTSGDQKDERHKLDISAESPKSDKSIERPDRLPLPEKLDLWQDPRAGEFQTALDVGGSFWNLDEMDEYEEPQPGTINQATNRGERNSELDEQERSLMELLDEFRNGRMRGLNDRQVSLMKSMKKAHEEVTRLHLALYPDHFTGFDQEEPDEERENDLYSKLSQQLYTMHSMSPAFF